MKNQTVLLIEDDASIREGVRIFVEAEGYMVEVAEEENRGKPAEAPVYYDCVGKGVPVWAGSFKKIA